MAATRPALEKRGPRIGDAASLWNFTPAPGWTKEEAHILKLCLMKHGVGRWIQILETGLLPGKLIQQLNGQTQRLLGQQSLAAYTGLHVDVDRIRADNDKVVDAQRKNGLVINSGPNLTKQQKQQLQEEAKAKYGLSEAEVQEAQEQLQEIDAQRGAGGPPGGAAGPQAQAEAAASGGTRGRAQREAALLALDTAGMSREQKLNFLLHMHAKLQQAATRLARALATGPQAAAAGAATSAAAAAAAAGAEGAAGSALGHAPHLYGGGGSMLQPAAATALPVGFGGSAENRGAAANTVAPVQLGAAPTWVLHPAPAAGVKRTAGGKRKAASGRRSSKAACSDTESGEDEWPAEPCSSDSEGGAPRGAAAAVTVADGAAAAGQGARRAGDMRAAAQVAVAADVEQLMAMGFSRKQARDALEECSYDVAAAVEWLVANCV